MTDDPDYDADYDEDRTVIDLTIEDPRWLASGESRYANIGEPLDPSVLLAGVVSDTLAGVDAATDMETMSRVREAYTDEELYGVRKRFHYDVLLETSLTGVDLLNEARARAVVHLLEAVGAEP